MKTKSTISKAANTMYTLAKKLGYWVVALESNENAVQFKSLSRKTARTWIDVNEPAVVLNEEVNRPVWRARYEQNNTCA